METSTREYNARAQANECLDRAEAACWASTRAGSTVALGSERAETAASAALTAATTVAMGSGAARCSRPVASAKTSVAALAQQFQGLQSTISAVRTLHESITTTADASSPVAVPSLTTASSSPLPSSLSNFPDYCVCILSSSSPASIAYIACPASF